MSKILQRIKKAYHLETDAEVADFLDLKPSTLSMQKNRGRLNLERIIEKCSDLNKNWLLDGVGNMRQKREDGGTSIPIYSSLNVEERNLCLDMSNKLGSVQIYMSKDQYSCSTQNKLIGYRITDNSMAPTLNEDDIAIIGLEHSDPAEESVYLVSYKQEVACRRVIKNGSSVEIRSDNGAHQPVEIGPNNKECSIVGKMLAAIRKI